MYIQRTLEELPLTRHKNSFVSIRFIIVITQFRVVIATKYIPDVTNYVNVSYVVGHE
jgi:hypothetical protein